jgi:hypothetical protein
MITKNNWITNNLSDRYTNRYSSFDSFLNPYAFKKLSFDEAVEKTVFELASNNLYLGLSGGYDSDFVLQAFHRHGVPITPVILCCGNEIENEFAFKTCKRLNIDPVFIQVSDEEFVNCFEENIFKKFNGIGYNSTQIVLACDYVAKNNGKLICGEHLIGDGNEIINAYNFAFINEWDYYHSYVYSTTPCIDFFLYSAELSYAMMPQHIPNMTWSQYKHELYNIEYRDKIKPKYSQKVKDHLMHLRGNIEVPVKTGDVWSKNDIDEIFKGVIHD